MFEINLNEYSMALQKMVHKNIKIKGIPNSVKLRSKIQALKCTSLVTQYLCEKSK